MNGVQHFVWARWWRARVAVRRLRGIRGDFRHGEMSVRATALTSQWMENWPEFAPSPHGHTHAHSRYTRGYVRFHSLTNHGNGRFTKAETREAMTRHTVALADLIELAGDPSLIVIAVDWGKNDLSGGWSRTAFPHAWPWLRWRDIGEDDDDAFAYFWVAPISTLADLAGPLERVVEQDGLVYITDSEMNWIYSPYDGGADVYARSIDVTDTLRGRHSDWLPAD